jgi:hypothetical protein
MTDRDSDRAEIQALLDRLRQTMARDNHRHSSSEDLNLRSNVSARERGIETIDAFQPAPLYDQEARHRIGEMIGKAAQGWEFGYLRNR